MSTIETMPLGDRDRFCGGGHPTIERITYVEFEIPGQTPDWLTGRTMPMCLPAPGVPAELPVGSTVNVCERWVGNQIIEWIGEVIGLPLVVCDPATFGMGRVGGPDDVVHVSVTIKASLRSKHIAGEGTVHYGPTGIERVEKHGVTAV